MKRILTLTLVLAMTLSLPVVLAEAPDMEVNLLFADLSPEDNGIFFPLDDWLKKQTEVLGYLPMVSNFSKSDQYVIVQLVRTKVGFQVMVDQLTGKIFVPLGLELPELVITENTLKEPGASNGDSYYVAGCLKGSHFSVVDFVNEEKYLDIIVCLKKADGDEETLTKRIYSFEEGEEGDYIISAPVFWQLEYDIISELNS